MLSNSLALVAVRAVSFPRYRLFFFPYAGGSAAAFANWGRALPDGVEMYVAQYKGRGSRSAEAPSRTIADMVEDLEPAVCDLLDQPFAFFGHSMGTAVSFELTRKLVAGRRPSPARLFISGRRAPHLPSSRKPIHFLPDDEFIASIGRMNGTPHQVLTNPELMRLLLPSLRADFEAVDSWSGRAEFEPLHTPFTLFGGKSDPLTPVHDLQAWSELTAAGAEMEVFHGGHFYLRQHYPVMLKAMWRSLGIA